MPDQVIPVQGLSDAGLIADVPSVALPPNAFSDCNNVRFRNNAASKVRGFINIFPHVVLGPEDIIKYIAWWPNPNLSIFNQGYYLVIIEQDGNDEVYLIKVGEAGTEDEPLYLDTNNTINNKGSFKRGGNWQHTFFQGGFALIINNGLEPPRFVLDNEDNVETVNVLNFADLPAWESYAADIPDYDGTGLTVTAAVIRSFGDFLVAGNLVERDPSDNSVIRALPGVIRTSDIAAPGDIPRNWNPFSDGVNTADEFTLTADGIVQDLVELQGKMFVYSNSSISSITRTGNATVPFSVATVTSVYGALTTDSVIEFDGRHFVVGAQDIYIFGGHPGSIQSVGEGRVRDYFYDDLSLDDIAQLFVIRYQQRDEIWICYPSSTAIQGRADKALVYNYRLNVWSKRDLYGAFNAVIGPIPGGGIPDAALTFDGAAEVSTLVEGVKHSVTISEIAAIEREGDGETFQQSVDFDVIPLARATGDIAVRVILNENFWTGNGTPLRFITKATDPDDNNVVDISLFLPTGLGKNPDEEAAVDFNSALYKSTVVNPIVNAIAVTDAVINGEVELTFVDDEALNNRAFEIVFNKEIIFAGESDIPDINATVLMSDNFAPIDEADFTVDDRADADQTGHELEYVLFPAGGSVFHFDFEEIWDTLDDYVFFFKQEELGPISGFQTYTDFPSDATVYYGSLDDDGSRTFTTTGVAAQTAYVITDDGDSISVNITITQVSVNDVIQADTTYSFAQATKTLTFNTAPAAGADISIIFSYNTIDGDMSFNGTEEMDGHDRVNTTFTIDDDHIVTEVLTGTRIKELIEESNALNLTNLMHLDLFVNQDIDEMHLIAYKTYDPSDGVADYDTQGIGTAIMTFDFYHAEFNKDANAWQKSTLATSIPVILESSGADQDAQNNMFLASAAQSIGTNNLFSTTSTARELTITGTANTPYILEVTLDGLVDTDEEEITLPDDFVNDVTRQGLAAYRNSNGTFVAPCLRISHTDPDGIDFFSFDTGIFTLNDGTGNSDLSSEDIYEIIDAQIQRVAPNQWRRSDRTWTSTEVFYDESEGDTGVPHPNADGTYEFPAERNADDFVISDFSGGPTRIPAPSFSIATQGSYEMVTPGSYFAMNLSNNITYLFPITSATVATNLEDQIIERVPELNVDIIGNNAGISISPAVIGENSVFVREAFFNTTDTIDDFRRLLDEPFEMDEQNVSLRQSLPEAVVDPDNAPFPSVDDGPLVSNSEITTDFDVDRTWPDDQVDFSYEFPLFSCGQVFSNGNSSNGIMAGEIGWAAPTFRRNGITYGAYESFVARTQMALSPEFDTEHLSSIALWLDGQTLDTFNGDYRYNVLQLNVSTTDNPGQRADLSNPQQSNTHYISEDYKMDVRLTGRFLNWNLTDNVTMTLESPGDKSFSQQTEWNLSGLQLSVRKAGRR